MSIFDTKVESLTGSTGKWMPSKGQHDAKVVGLIDIGQVDKTNDAGETYKVQGIDLIWAVAERNSNGEHMIIRQSVTASLKDKTRLGAIVKDAGWKLDSIRDILGKTAKVFVKHKTSKKTGKDYAAIGEDLMEGGCKLDATVVLPYWYADQMSKMILIDGVTIGTAPTASVRQPVSSTGVQASHPQLSKVLASQQEMEQAAADELPW